MDSVAKKDIGQVVSSAIEVQRYSPIDLTRPKHVRAMPLVLRNEREALARKRTMCLQEIALNVARLGTGAMVCANISVRMYNLPSLQPVQIAVVHR